MLKLGSLFDGSGGFPLAAQLCGIEPVWASEVEPFPIAVTRKRFPQMKHLGDVSAINGAEIEPADIITFGSPCQDLSVAGKRAGLGGDRSGLFMEAIRIIKEMREKTDGLYPRIAIWENVPGAFSSAKGEDFRAVLQAFVTIADETVDVPRPPKGKWNNSGEIVGDGWSVAWRVLDAQYWGVPQRRRRIFLVADYHSERAGEILFKRDGLSRDFAEIKQAWENPATAVETGVGDICEPRPIVYGICADASNCMKSSNPHSGIYEADTARTLDLNGGNPSCSQGGIAVLQAYDARGNGDGAIAPTITGDHQNRVTDYTAVVVGIDPYKRRRNGVVYAIGNGQADNTDFSPLMGALNCMHDQQAVMQVEGINGDIAGTIDASYFKGTGARNGKEREVIVALDRAAYNQGENAQYDPGIDDSGKHYSVVAKGPGAVCYAIQGSMIGRKDENGPQGDGINEGVCFTVNTIDRHGVCYAVNEQTGETVTFRLVLRRLMPVECARLQGFPDWWTDGLEVDNPTEEEMAFWREVFETHRRIVTGASKPKTDKQIRKWLAKPHSDSAEYKMWGNGVALPCVMYVMEGIAREMEEI